jgi:hypothetical protein
MPRSLPEITSSDIPQAPNLARIRCVVTAIAGGAATVEKIAEETDISARHIGYAVRAAQTLGLLSADKAVTPLGRTLLESEQESDEELDAFRRSIEESAILSVIAPRLLSPKPPSKKALAARIERLSGLSKATAEHRASDLLAWREQLSNEPAAAAAPGPMPRTEPEER